MNINESMIRCKHSLYNYKSSKYNNNKLLIIYIQSFYECKYSMIKISAILLTFVNILIDEIRDLKCKFNILIKKCPLLWKNRAIFVSKGNIFMITIEIQKIKSIPISSII